MYSYSTSLDYPTRYRFLYHIPKWTNTETGTPFLSQEQGPSIAPWRLSKHSWKQRSSIQKATNTRFWYPDYTRQRRGTGHPKRRVFPIPEWTKRMYERTPAWKMLSTSLNNWTFVVLSKGGFYNLPHRIGMFTLKKTCTCVSYWSQLGQKGFWYPFRRRRWYKRVLVAWTRWRNL